MTAPSFNELLHALRGAELRRMPPGARTVLSAGCAGGWYFRWIAENYPGIERHIGIEAYSPKPDDLPAGVEWITNSVGDMRAVASSSVDLVFSGQNIEHLVVGDVAGFLCEARRVLKSAGLLVLDSPNRTVIERIGWFHPEHVVEFRVDEIRELVELAGFDVVSIRGMWQCYDPSVHRTLALDPGDDEEENGRRVEAGAASPENAFAWWLVARRGERVADRGAVERRTAQIARVAWSHLSTRFHTQVGTFSHDIFGSEAKVAQGIPGCLLYGPYVPLFPGHYRIAYRLRVPSVGSGAAPRGLLARVDVGAFAREHRELAACDVSATDLSRVGPDGYATVRLDLRLTEAVFGAEFRVHATGRGPLAVAVPVQVDRIDRVDR